MKEILVVAVPVSMFLLQFFVCLAAGLDDLAVIYAIFLGFYLLGAFVSTGARELCAESSFRMHRFELRQTPSSYWSCAALYIFS